MLGNQLKKELRNFFDENKFLAVYQRGEEDPYPYKVAEESIKIDDIWYNYYQCGLYSDCSDLFVDNYFYSTVDKAFEKMFWFLQLEDDAEYDVDYSVFEGGPIVERS